MAAPDPVSLTVGVPRLLPMLNVPAWAAPAVGVSVTATLHCTGAGNDPTQVFELTENGAVAETVPNATGPELVTVTLKAGLGKLCGWWPPLPR
jgi:hypothetical protein